ncbi:MAG: glycosyltransferase [Cypionkella sp.]|uniref:glycosyltransferase family 2 protein n=1 Tax=Cypionkella sp. TaxID=2811411 RepID=UPI002638A3CE|nr:glycosyltransferase family 2 protein [Cypionkella sp.]MDB5661567.1 glycosyltransferase [Cypionkella sp.]
MTPEAAVIIPHYNDVARLGRCLDRLMVQDRSGVEVVVVDNGSTMPLADLIAAHPQARFVIEPRKGAAMARNRGVAETSAPRLFFLDSDCLPDVDWLAIARRVCVQSDLVGGAIKVFDETPPPRNGAQAFEAVFGFNYRHYIEKKGFSVTANLLTRRDVFQAVGPFVPGLSEDLDWCHRARDLDYKLTCAEDLRVAHPSRSDWAALRRKWLRLTQEEFGVNGSTFKRRLRWGLKALAMPASIFVHAPKLLFSPRLGGVNERLAGLATLIRLRLRRCGWMLRQTLGLPN